jgi:tetratricopeptide (TPR) repeat protein
MKILSILFFFIIFIACSQNQQAKKYIPNPKAKQLADSAAMVLMYTNDKEKAIALLDQAIQIDSNYYLAYANKLGFQASLNRFNDALVTAKNLIRIKPQSPDAHTAVGMIYWKTGDSVSAINHFTKASTLFDKILDTMSKSNKYYESALMNKAFNFILLGQQEKGNEILRELYNKQTDEDQKKMYEQFLNKSRKEIIDDLFTHENSVSSSDPKIKK